MYYHISHIYTHTYIYRHLARALAFATVQRSAVVLPSLCFLPSIAMDDFIVLLAATILLVAVFFAGLAAGWLLSSKILDLFLRSYPLVDVEYADDTVFNCQNT